jgi:hypothetical protein
MKNQRLTSPLSIKACKLKGVTEEDLRYITLEEYINSHQESKNLPKEFQQERYDNYEQNRRDLIESLKEVRNDLKKTLEKQIKRTKTLSEENDDDRVSYLTLFGKNCTYYQKSTKNKLTPTNNIN